MEFAALRIIHYPDPRLKQPARPVEKFDADLAALAARMLELMREADGIGLAAPQVGLSLQLFVCNVTGEPGDDRVIVNPRLSDLEGDVESEEGCLSIPEVSVKLRRAVSCTLHAVDANGRPFVEPASDLLARCWQHECDHLAGVLILDHMSEADRIANRRLLKQLEGRYKRPARRA